MFRNALLAISLVACAPAFAIDIVETSSPAAPISVTLPPVVDSITLVDSLGVQDVEVTLDILHTWQADLEISIASPAGTSVQLTNDSGGSADNVFCTFGVLGNPFTPAFLAVAGAEMEAQGPGAMADFVGQDSLGSWTLTINDDAGGDDGTLNSWTLRVSDDPAVPALGFPPNNDDCAAAETVGLNSTTSYNTDAATASGIDNGCSGAGDNLDVWYEISLPSGCSGTVDISVCAATYTSTVAIYDGSLGCPTAGSVPLDCSSDNCGTGISYSHPVGGPTLIYVQVGGLNGDAGFGELTVSTVLNGPTNDFCIDAELITLGSTVFYDTSCATQDGINPGCGSTTTDPVDVWYTVEVPAGCNALTLTTDGSSFDTRLAVWDGTTCPVPGDVPLACDDDGGAGLQSLIELTGLTSGQILLVQVGGFSGATGAGQLDVTCFIPEIENLACVPNPDTIDVSWTNPAVYDEIVITLDTVVVATLPGTDSSYQVTGLSSFTGYTVGVQGVQSGIPAAEITCSVTTPGDTTGQVVIVAAELPSDIDSVTALDLALQSTGVTPAVVAAIGDIGGTPASVWVILGTFPDRHVLTPDEGLALVALQAAGVPLYVSGGDTWGFDAQTEFELIDGIASATDGNDSHVSMTGADFLAGFDAAYNQDQAGNDYTDQLVPATADSLGPDARVIFVDGAGAYNTAVAYYVSMGGPVVSMSSEFGGYAGDQDALAAALVGFLGGTVVTPGDQFRRGDTNGDGGFDISDTIFLLGSLFVPGSTPIGCADTGDANDDGGIDISDAVYMLSALFVPGSPNPAAPGPTDCGTDPTMDSLDCATYTTCP